MLDHVVQAVTAVTIERSNAKDIPKEKEESWKTVEKKRISREKALLQKVVIDRVCVLCYRISYLTGVSKSPYLGISTPRKNFQF